MNLKFLSRISLFVVLALLLSSKPAHAAPPTKLLIYSGTVSAKNFGGNSYFAEFKPGTLNSFFVVDRVTGESRSIFYGKSPTGSKKRITTLPTTLIVSIIGLWPSSYMTFSGNNLVVSYLAVQYARGKVRADVPLNLSGGTANVPKSVSFLYRDISEVLAVLGECNSVGTLKLDLERSQANNEANRNVEETVAELGNELSSRGFTVISL